MATPWKQELMWVKRDERGVVVRLSEKPPQSGEIIPLLPRKECNCKCHCLKKEK